MKPFKDIINQILKYYSKESNTELVFQPYGSKSYDPKVINLENHESVVSEFFNTNIKEQMIYFQITI
ncbi:MAG: hypothetical protein Ct9H90mP2_03140 [Dehalococcoidia bacterium]|nr:MAG: hypothetical protein Ct9H90mP2_03140 [Dehalococcoidia bacterium]